MGDIFFIIRMAFYTLVLVIIMQVKIGSTTIEQKVIDITHNSQAAGVLQGFTQGAATFIGIQYNRATGHLKSRFIKEHSSDNRPGSRLQEKLSELQDSINKKWEEHEKSQYPSKEEHGDRPSINH